MKSSQKNLLAQSLCWAHVSTPQNTTVFLRVETLSRLDLEPKTNFLDSFIKGRNLIKIKVVLKLK